MFIFVINVIELFAGVGGFRVGLERNKGFNTVWANQWEPSTKVQHAFDIYSSRFTNGVCSNKDIALVDEKEEIPKHDLLVGGFPCQDYSVARSLNGESGIQGKKGVLFWEIMRIINHHKPKFVLLENVDRLLKSPSKQRGRDFAVMLASFRDAGYIVEWRVINAADYGLAQRRRRVFIFASKNDTFYANNHSSNSLQETIHDNGFFTSEFPIAGISTNHPASHYTLPQDIVEISDNFAANFRNAGIMKDGYIYTEEIIPHTVQPTTLREIMIKARDYQIIDEKYYIDDDKIGRNGKTTLEHFEYLKGSKKVNRTSSTGHSYTYSEGSMNFPDDLDNSGRTMLTSEGTKNRSTHVVEDLDTGRLRILTPVECELLNDFPPNWTEGISDRNRYFCMGNALVVGLVEKMGRKISEIYEAEINKVK